MMQKISRRWWGAIALGAVLAFGVTACSTRKVASTNGPTMIVNSNGVVTHSLSTSDAGHIRN